jgi:hypothetical protein
MELLWNPIGFKAGATNKSMWKKLKAKKPFFSSPKPQNPVYIK